MGEGKKRGERDEKNTDVGDEIAVLMCGFSTARAMEMTVLLHRGFKVTKYTPLPIKLVPHHFGSPKSFTIVVLLLDSCTKIITNHIGTACLGIIILLHDNHTVALLGNANCQSVGKSYWPTDIAASYYISSLILQIYIRSYGLSYLRRFFNIPMPNLENFCDSCTILRFSDSLPVIWLLLSSFESYSVVVARPSIVE
ncbi:uncharacterized protein BDR25DRAFT_352053 [Lindgomyces ingoldianus]|uniref:Uncharacterized protein n=1 Tax=Lindgomyces ingoldianus TaxID=673940 RepID=A0ACB6R401_9PLEO|nr:uncharacterized protein BDR25DRAFT_352053 [Lindgomyces ingoldianus]KAF2473558.1 hypothetical protein BDR25DRAFT_352053 [Lindgomyces ingoldianus]